MSFEAQNVGQIPAGPTSNLDNHNPEWITAKTRGRWAPYWNAQTRTYNPPRSERRTEARRKKYAWSATTMRGGPEHVPLALCMSGNELLAEHARGRIRGDGTSFLARAPFTDEAAELIELLPWKRLGRNEAKLLVAFSYAMIERKRHGLVATVDELCAFLGLEKTATKDALARLIALGWLHRKETYTQYGACWNQRANIWRLTVQAFEAWDLDAPPAEVAVPTGTVDRARLEQRRRRTTRTETAGGTPPANCQPESGCHSGSTEVHSDPETSGSFRNGSRTDRSEIDGPTTATGAVGPARLDETPPRHPAPCNAPRKAPDGRRSAARAEARAAVTAWVRELELRPEVEARAARERAEQRHAEVRAELATRAAKRAFIANDDADLSTLAALITDPRMRAAAEDAKRGPRTLDDSELRFALLDLHDEPSSGGAS